MGGDDSPTLGESYPRLHLPPDFWAGPSIAIEQRRRHRGVTAIGGDHSLVGLAHQPDRRARGAERHDRLTAVEILADAIAQRALVIAEQLVEDGDIVVDERLLIALELR